MRAESGFMDREIGMGDAFSDEGNEKPVCLQFQEMSGSPENQKYARIWKWSIEHYPWMKQNNSGV